MWLLSVVDDLAFFLCWWWFFVDLIKWLYNSLFVSSLLLLVLCGLHSAEVTIATKKRRRIVSVSESRLLSRENKNTV